MMKKLPSMLFVLLVWNTVGLAEPIKGVEFPDSVVVADTELTLRGVAVLKWAMFFSVYAGAFYLPAEQPGNDWHEDIPKMLELAYFRDFKAEDFSSSSEKLLKRDLTETEFKRLEGRLEDFCNLFRDVKAGDRYSLTYSPATGTELWLNNQRLGAVPGNDFATAYFGIWLGPTPINTTFRDRLLGAR